jgi:hypothetical protein
MVVDSCRPGRPSRLDMDLQSRMSRTAAATVREGARGAGRPADVAEPAVDDPGAEAGRAGGAAAAGRAAPCSPSAAAACSSGQCVIEGNSSFGSSQTQTGASRSVSCYRQSVRAS